MLEHFLTAASYLHVSAVTVSFYATWQKKVLWISYTPKRRWYITWSCSLSHTTTRLFACRSIPP